MSDPQPAKWWWAVWSVGLFSTTASLFVTSMFAGAFLKPHAFGARDGQGAAGLALLILLVGAVAGLISGVVLVLSTMRVRRRLAAPWLWPVSLGVPPLVGLAGLALAIAS